MRSLLTLGLLTTSLLAGPSPDQRDLNNYTFDGRQMGCLTRGYTALNGSSGVRVEAAHRQEGVTVRLDKRDLQHVWSQMNLSVRTCMSQVLNLITPDAPGQQSQDQIITLEFRR